MSEARRLLRALESAGLITVGPSPADGRVRVARLTRAGQAERALLVRRSDELETNAIRSGASVARLETNGALVEAITMYRTAGYVEVAPWGEEPFAHHWFAKRLG
jgi:DNA-binding MarR family transcriptional regulator